MKKVLMVFMVAVFSWALTGCGLFEEEETIELTGISFTMDDEYMIGDTIKVSAEPIPSNAKFSVGATEVVFVDDMDGKVTLGNFYEFQYSTFGTFSFYIQHTNGVTSDTITISINPYTVSTEAELIEKMSNLNASFRLAADITLTDAWTSVGTESSPFNGKIDGDGHTISGLDLTDCDEYCGFVSYLGDNATIENLIFDDATLEANHSGIVAGISYGLIDNVTVNGTINVLFGDYVGGIAGTNMGVISNSTNNIDITSYGNIVGGIAGNTNTFLASIDGEVVRKVLENNVNNGDIIGKDNVGGLFGKAKPNAEDLWGRFDTESIMVIKDSVNNGNVTGQNNIGGLIGYSIGRSVDTDSHTAMVGIVSSINNGTITGEDYVGGAIGNGEEFVREIIGFTNEGTISGDLYVGGVVGAAFGRYSRVVTITNSTNNGAIYGNALVGGIAGETEYVDASTNNGLISSTGTFAVEKFDNAASYTGGIAGKAVGVKDSQNNVDINVVSGGAAVGGIVGYLLGLELEGNNNQGGVTSNGNYVGGIAGYVYMNFNIGLDEKTYYLDDNENHGNIVGVNYVGGLFGKLNSWLYKGGFAAWSSISGTPEFSVIVKDSTNHASVSGVDYVGGIMGYAQGRNLYDYGRQAFTYISIISCVNNGNVMGEDFIAGIIGTVEEEYFEVVRNCTNAGEIRGIQLVTQIAYPVHIIEDCFENGTVVFE